jgi:hypothetical protein
MAHKPVIRSVGFYMTLAGLAGLFSLAAGTNTARFWWWIAWGFFVAGLLILYIEQGKRLSNWWRDRRDPEGLRLLNRIGRELTKDEPKRPAKPRPPWPKDPNETYGGQDESTMTAGPDYWVVRCRLERVGTGWRRLRCVAIDALGNERFTDVIPRPARDEAAAVLDPHVFPETQPPGRVLSIRWEHDAGGAYTHEVIAERRLPVPPLLESRHGWSAEHKPFGRDETLILQSDNEVLSGFRCIVRGPAGTHEVDERTHVFVPKDALGYPEPRQGTNLLYPSGFADGPKEGALPPGDYEVFWWGWEYVDFTRYEDVFLARTSFTRPRLTR